MARIFIDPEQLDIDPGEDITDEDLYFDVRIYAVEYAWNQRSTKVKLTFGENAGRSGNPLADTLNSKIKDVMQHLNLQKRYAQQ